VTAFRQPAWRNARQTLVVMGSLPGAIFLGLSVLAGHLHVTPFTEGTPTIIAQIGDLVYGGGPRSSASSPTAPARWRSSSSAGPNPRHRPRHPPAGDRHGR
jgi:hypothetical protein